jgi:hypothetical protein
MSGYVGHVDELINGGFRAERAVSPRDGGVWWVVLDAELVVHREASAFLSCLQGADRSPHTVRAYAGRAALFLGWCAGQGWTGAASSWRSWPGSSTGSKSPRPGPVGPGRARRSTRS